MATAARELVIKAVRGLGIVDVDAIDLPAFRDAVAGVKDYNDAQHVARDIRRQKPGLFPDAQRLDEAAFDTLDETVRETSRILATSPRRPPVNLRAIDARKLDDGEFEDFSQAMRASVSGNFNAIDVGKIHAMAARQGVATEALETW